MSFWHPRDPEFTRARAIRRGEKKLDPSLNLFVERFTERFGVVPLMVTTDTIGGRGGSISRPRLTIVLERSAELKGFMSRSGFSFLADKQAITAQIWAETSVERPSAWRSALSLRDTEADETLSILVCFAEFEQVAEYAAHRAVSGKDLRTFATSLGLGDRLWRLERSFGSPIVFVHSDEQARALRSTETQAHWADLYFTPGEAS